MLKSMKKHFCDLQLPKSMSNFCMNALALRLKYHQFDFG